MIKIFDRKFEFHALLVYPNFVYWQLNDFFTNWIEPPPGISIENWINTFCEILSNFLDIRIAARGLIASKILWLCKERNSIETGIYPTLRDVYQLIRNTKYHLLSHTARYQETVSNRFEGLFAVFGDHICSQRKQNWENFLKTNWAISLDGIPVDYQNLFITVTISKIMMYRMAHNMRNNQLCDLFVFDEASTMFRKYYEQREGAYLLTDYLAKAREFGIGFIISTQNLSNLADSVLSNTSTKIMVGGAGLGKDYDIFAQATGIDFEQKEFMKQLMQPGMAVVKDPSYPHAFLLEVPRIA